MINIIGSNTKSNILLDYTNIRTHWDFSDSNCYSGSGNSINDLVGSVDGTVDGATFNGKDGFDFDGIDDFIETSEAMRWRYNEHRTFLFIIKTIEAGSRHLLANYDPNNGRRRSWMGENTIRTYHSDSATSSTGYNFSSSQLNKIIQVGFGIGTGAEAMDFHFNGVKISDQPFESAPTSFSELNAADFETFGRRWGASGIGWFKGTLYAMTSYNTRPTDDEIENHYNHFKSKISSL